MNFSKTFKQAMVAMLSFAIAGGPALAARTTTYFHTDATGSVVATTNEAGAVLSRKDYAPFGEQLNSPPDAAEPLVDASIAIAATKGSR